MVVPNTNCSINPDSMNVPTSIVVGDIDGTELETGLELRSRFDEYTLGVRLGKSIG